MGRRLQPTGHGRRQRRPRPGAYPPGCAKRQHAGAARRRRVGRYVIDHFYRKLFKLADKMNTPSARQEALRRAAFMRHYLAELAREIGTGAE